jgi:hypothetical protein
LDFRSIFQFFIYFQVSSINHYDLESIFHALKSNKSVKRFDLSCEFLFFLKLKAMKGIDSKTFQKLFELMEINDTITELRLSGLN